MKVPPTGAVSRLPLLSNLSLTTVSTDSVIVTTEHKTTVLTTRVVLYKIVKTTVLYGEVIATIMASAEAEL